MATARPIDDDAACQFAENFYRKLTAGHSLRDAFDQAQELVNPGGRFTPRDMINQRVDFAPEDITGNRGFPWVLRCRDGSHVEYISLPKLAGDPLFGLPGVPKGEHLPPSPYRHLKPFTRKEAAVFFGRGQAIRSLYDLATSPSGRPVILYSGPTGVGKSSVLDAGLRPRLEPSHRIVYLERKADLGLLGTLLRGLSADSRETAADLNRLWVDSEETIDKPLIVVLDQAEEAFTRPQGASPIAEVAALVQAVREAFLGPLRSPRGKLILGFRKEWLQEFERSHDEIELGYERMLLAPLDRAGLIEAIEGPIRDPDLRRHYGLTIEPGLAERIAGELEHDAGSALAPTLQVLLTKLWESAGGKGASFTGDLYDGLKDRGFLLKDVLDEGLKALAAWRPELVDSGFALDLLEHHTTSMDTAEIRTRADLLARYPHQADVLGECLRILQKSYLLIPAETRWEADAPATPPDQPRPDAAATRLGHDTLAPLVREMFRTSVAPGQLARRLLENRAPEWQDGKTGHVLDSTDLRAVEASVSGMRAWTTDEARLVEASRRAEEEQRIQEQERERRLHEAERQAEEETKRRLKEQEESNARLRKRAVALGATLAVTVGVALLAADRWRAAVRATGIANENQDRALQGLYLARAQLIQNAWREARIDRALALLAEQRPQGGGPDWRSFEWPYMDRLTRTELKIWADHQSQVTSVAFSPDGSTLVSGGLNGQIWVRRLDERPALRSCAEIATASTHWPFTPVDAPWPVPGCSVLCFSGTCKMPMLSRAHSGDIVSKCSTSRLVPTARFWPAPVPTEPSVSGTLPPAHHGKSSPRCRRIRTPTGHPVAGKCKSTGSSSPPRLRAREVLHHHGLILGEPNRFPCRIP